MTDQICPLCRYTSEGELTTYAERYLVGGFWASVDDLALVDEPIDGYQLCSEHRPEHLASLFKGWAAIRDREASAIGIEVAPRDRSCSPAQVEELLELGSRELFERARTDWRAACEVRRRRRESRRHKVLKLWAKKVAHGVELYFGGRPRPVSVPEGFVRFASLEEAMREAHQGNWA